MVALIVVIQLLETVLNAGEEQGLVPDEWDSSKAGAYALSFVAVAVIAPIVEELTYRGLGYSLLEPFGRWVGDPRHGRTVRREPRARSRASPSCAVRLRARLAALEDRQRLPGDGVHAVFNASCPHPRRSDRLSFAAA